MKIEVCKTDNDVCLRAKKIIVSTLQQHKALTLCAASGQSPTKLYEMLIEENAANPGLFSNLRVIKLDEWGGIPMSHKGTCETYLQSHLIQPLKVSKNRYIAFHSNSENPEKECNRIQQEIDKFPIDICILGIGMNGHIAFNEPNDYLLPYCHIATLSATTLKHPMVDCDDNANPSYGLTLGISNIMKSKLIILLINGVKKRKIAKSLFQKKISTQLPASLLWVHPNTICLIDEEANDFLS